VSELQVAGDKPTATFGPTRTIITSVYEFDPLALEELAQWLEQRGLRTPVSQLIGPKQYNEIGYVETSTPVTVASGATTTVLSLTVALAANAPLIVTVNFPSFNFTATSGGDAQVLINVGATVYTVGRLTADRQLAWPALLVRRQIAVGGTVTLSLAVQSVVGAVTLQAGANYGTISLQVQAK